MLCRWPFEQILHSYFLSRSAPLSISISERKCCGVDQMFLKVWLTWQLVLRVSCPNWERFVRNWTVENVHVVNWVRDACLFEWDRNNVNVKAFGSEGGLGACSPGKLWNLGPLNGWICTRNFAKLMFSVFKSTTLPWLSKIFKNPWPSPITTKFHWWPSPLKPQAPLPHPSNK